ncbi:MAG: hypothetical protein ACRCZP_10185 [Phycicoccus sp.]
MTTVRETMRLTEAAAGEQSATGRQLIQVISPGWGSSGFYSADVLETAGTNSVFAAGTHMYIDHPSASENADRPERSVRDLAAVLAEDARWDPGVGALVAEARVLEQWRGPLKEMQDVIGVSIRCGATISEGEVEGRRGVIVDELIASEANSVDFVTHAGRGGKILEVLESARPAAVAERAVQHGVAEATVNDTRDAIGAALSARFGDDDTWVWLSDFDDEVAWYEVDGVTFQLGYEVDGEGRVTLEDADPVEVQRKSEYVPVLAGSQESTNQESTKEDPTMSEQTGQTGGGGAETVAVEASRLTTLERDAARVTSAESAAAAATRRVQAAEAAQATRVQAAEAATAAAEARAQDAERRLSEMQSRLNVQTSHRLIHEAAATKDVTLDQWQVIGLTNDMPLSEDGTVDEDAMTQRASEAIARLATEYGTGRVRGVGGDTGGVELTEADVDAEIAAAFGRSLISTSKEA